MLLLLLLSHPKNFGHFGWRPFVNFIAKCVNRDNMVMEGENTAGSTLPWREGKLATKKWVELFIGLISNCVTV